MGVMPEQSALNLAAEEGLDLVIVAANAQPPVARIIDKGKYRYQREKKQQRNKKSSRVNELKQMRFGLKIGDHDMDVKLRKVRKFLDSGCKVRLTVVLKGREMIHKDLAFDLAKKLTDKLGNNSIAVEQQPQLIGRQVNMIIRGVESA